MGTRTGTVSRKNVTVINFARSHAQSRVSIDFLCIFSEILIPGREKVEWKSERNENTRKFNCRKPINSEHNLHKIVKDSSPPCLKSQEDIECSRTNTVS
ncbi:hypothetical protein BHM03_00048629 [Ensete ventricosum]|nr:hypothetical protein BHM03_00048629 [Ensete ventricosum]